MGETTRIRITISAVFDKIAVISCILVSCTSADTTGDDERNVSECISKVLNCQTSQL